MIAPALKSYKNLVILLIVFGIIYGLISLVNHYNFRTYALDLGLVNHAIYDYAHFRVNYSTLLVDAAPMNFLGSHFTLLPVLFSPLYWLLGSYTLLVVQIAAVLFGGVGIYAYCRHRSTGLTIPLLITAQFFFMWGIYSALAFDYHDNMVGAMFLPWFFHYFDQKKYWLATVFFGLLVISKENMALWGVFIAVACLGKYFSDKSARKVALSLAIFTLFYFMMVTSVIMPQLNTTHHQFAQLIRYQHLGNSFGSIIQYLWEHPGVIFSHLFLNTTGNPKFNYIKAELYGMILLSGGISFFFRPWYLFLLLPIFAQKLLTHDFTLWGINYQYSIEFAPVLALATFEASTKFTSVFQKRYLVAFLVLTLAATSVTLVKRKSKWFIKPMVQFQRRMHYRSLFDREKLHAMLQLIPGQVPVSASSCLTPRLVEREKLYHFPVIRDAAYIALVKTTEEGTYPLSPVAYNQKIIQLRQNLNFKIIYEDEQAILFQKRKM
ncbi:DUF2079 domain-containing protein [Adhaeribacter radiodurans]|uniref:DUF2079 domain-containing protein n=1 Tax=Adhaeribacter radiodurans TaxID=2745197 RepID=A0A7L7L2F8_9BACT|nr:DUF2079 domain-containing protein [Adhaeribacter radiodurans]QMU26775.1 DUF2079 domain-containing protein [Adhaeribacter radiodurans]